MIKSIISDGQNILDVAIQEYGAVEGVFQLIADNPTLTIDSVISAGDQLVIDETKVLNKNMVLYFQNSSTRINTGEDSADDDGYLIDELGEYILDENNSKIKYK